MRLYDYGLGWILATATLGLGCDDGSARSSVADGAGLPDGSDSVVEAAGGASGAGGLAGHTGGAAGHTGGAAGHTGGAAGHAGGAAGHTGGAVSTPDAGDASTHDDAAPPVTHVPEAGDGGPSTSASRFTAHPFGGSSTAPNGYYEYLPRNYAPPTASPLLVFWHGIGEDGDGQSELSKITSTGVPKLLANNQWPDSRPFVVLSPQYTGVSGEIAPGKGCPSSATIHAFLTWALAHYTIDPKRVFLTGLSCGAIGSWDYLAEHHGAVVAAVVLISGNPGDPTAATSTWQRAGGCALGNDTAIWSLHGDQDGVVPYAPDHDTMQRLLACPTPPRRSAIFTPIVGGSHLIWDPIYDLSGGNGDVYRWLLDNPKP